MHEKASYSYFTEYGLFHYKPSEFRVLLGLFTLDLALLLSVYTTALISIQIVHPIAILVLVCLPLDYSYSYCTALRVLIGIPRGSPSRIQGPA